MSEGMTLNEFVVFIQAQLKLYVQRQVAAAMLEADASSIEAKTMTKDSATLLRVLVQEMRVLKFLVTTLDVVNERAQEIQRSQKQIQAQLVQLVARGDRMDLAGSKDGSSKLKRKNSVARNWSSRDVAEYLEGLTEVFGDRTKEYSNVMMSENINGEALMELSDSDLKEMKFTMGHRKLLLSRIALLEDTEQQAC